METGIIAIIPAAGSGRRFSSSICKTFQEILGIPLLIHTLKRLHKENSITEIIPVLRHQDINMGYAMFREYGLSKIKLIAEGGKERQDSVNNALKLIEDSGDESHGEKLVLIHDGARPIIPKGTIEELSTAINNSEGAAPGIPAKETLKEVSGDGTAICTVARDRIHAIQTPQVFPFSIIKKAYDMAYEKNFYATDDAALVEMNGGRVKIIKGSHYNIKVTTPEDLKIVECLLKEEDGYLL